MVLFKKLFFSLIVSLLIFCLIFSFFTPIFNAKTIIFPYAVHPFDIVQKYPNFWKFIKISFVFNLFFSIFVITNSFLSFFVPQKEKKIKLNRQNHKLNNNLSLMVGNNFLTGQNLYIEDAGLYQNILVTGTIGSRQNKFCSLPFFFISN